MSLQDLVISFFLTYTVAIETNSFMFYNNKKLQLELKVEQVEILDLIESITRTSECLISLERTSVVFV